ncbi:MAG: condensation domain-containing protein [Peptostreptococcus sp.]|uniref:condensation domain-containing protein n=1 Tax=Peptostreptococcus sp. TaxID=1262 RepID=UPI000764181B|nr:condensation domain-containing protein [Peptostreptococcus sp.]MDU5350746.1 condensation domain-containing protein [Peptostreptococcus sp.]MDU5890366.1 condensation domain-containing protein [Peptostreptococcus sp.]
MKNFIDKLNSLGIEIWISGDKLGYRSPKGVMSKELLNEIIQNKDELIQYLKFKTVIVHDEENRYKPFPLTDIQSAYLRGRQLSREELGGIGCCTMIEIESELLDPLKFESAWHKTIKKHDMLKAIIFNDGTQIIQESFDLPKLEVHNFDEDINLLNSSDVENIRKQMKKMNFEIENYPMHKFVLCNGVDRTLIFFTVDMLVADYPSINKILNDIFYFYYKSEVDESSEDNKSKINYRDIVLFNHRNKESKIYEKSRKYWINNIQSEEFCSPELPLKVEANHQNPSFLRKKLFIESNDWDSFKSISKKFGLTPSNSILSVYSEVIKRWSTNKEFCINVTTMQRDNNFLDIVGDFTSTNILKIKDNNDVFFRVASEIQSNLFKDLEFMSFSGVNVLRELNKRLKRRTIIPVVFTSTIGINLDKNKSYDISENGVKIIGGVSKTPQVWVDCQLIEKEDGLQINWDYVDNLFKDQVIDDMFESFSDTIKTLCINEEKWAEKQIVEIKKGAEKIIEKEEITDRKILYKKIIENTEKYRNDTAIICGKEKCTYGELRNYIGGIISKLKDHNVNKGDLVAILYKNEILKVASVIATLIYGSYFIYIDERQSEDAKKTILNRYSPKYLLSNEFIHGYEEQTIIICKDTKYKELDIPYNIMLNDVAYITHTNSNNQNLDGVLVTHDALVNAISCINESFYITNEDVLLSSLNLTSFSGLFNAISCLSNGATLVLQDSNKKFDIYNEREIILLNKITIWNCYSREFEKFVKNLNASKKDKIFKNLRLVFLSGQVNNIKILKKAENLFMSSYKIINFFEYDAIGIWGAYRDITNKLDNPIVPIRNIRHFILDKKLIECPSLVDGDIYVQDITVGKSRNNGVEVNSREIIKTEYLGYFDNNGEVYIRGKNTRTVVRDNKRINLDLLEKYTSYHPKIKGSVAVPYKNKLDDIKIALFIESEKTMLEEDQKNLEKRCIEELIDIDRHVFLEWKKQSDICAISDIINMLLKVGLFTNTDKYYSLREIYNKVNPTLKYKRSLERMLNVLIKEKILDKSGDLYKLTSKNDDYYDREKSWNKLLKIEEVLHYSPVLYEYQKESGSKILEQLREEVSGVSLFFPRGDTKVAMAAYEENLINKRLNKIISNIINVRYRAGKYLKILEVGAGVGGTTDELLKSLTDDKVEYHFSDISYFFINEAKKKYSHLNNVVYEKLDINKDFREQNFNEKEFDIVLCANVLHNSKNIGEVLKKINGLLKQKGDLIILEATNENYSLLTSMELKGGLDGFTDHRKKNLQVFTSREKWASLLEQAGFKRNFILPRKDDELISCGQSVFYYSKDNGGLNFSDINEIDEEKIKEFLLSKLSCDMLPDTIVKIEQLPLTDNGVIDFNKLSENIKPQKQESLMNSNELALIENGIMEIWKELLDTNELSLTDNFYSVGGDSLLIAQVVTKIKDNIDDASSFTWDELMRKALDNPTIKGISRVIYKDKKQNFEENKNQMNDEGNMSNYRMVMYKQAKTKNEKITALFHSGTGRLIDYKFLADDLIKKVSEETSIVGFSYGNHNEYINISCEELILKRAQAYADDLIKMGGKSYELIGYCVGGFLAFEVSRILLENGFNVTNTVIISSHLCLHNIKNQLLMEYAYGEAIGLNMKKAGYQINDSLLKKALKDIIGDENRDIKNSELINLSGEYENIGKFFMQQINYSHEERLTKIFNSNSGDKFNGEDSTMSMLMILYDIFEHTFKGMMEYRPSGSYIGPVKVLIPNESAEVFYPDIINDVNWYDLCLGELEVKNIDGNHATCLNEENYKNILMYLD